MDEVSEAEQILSTIEDAGSERITITDQIRAALSRHRERTACATTRLLRSAVDCPPGLNPQLIKSWIRGDAGTARADHLDYVLKRWALMPSVEIVPITADTHAALCAERDRTGCGAIKLLKNVPGKPEGLKVHLVQSWLDRGAKSARRDHLEFVFEAWRSCDTRKVQKLARPDLATVSEFVILKPKDREYLHVQKQRTGRGTHSLLKNMPDVPGGLTPRVIEGWLDGRCRTARKDHLAYVCVIRFIPTGESDRSRPPIPIHSDH